MEDEKQIIRGKVYVLGDNIDTDQIIPAMYLNLVPTIPEEYRKLGSYAMAGLPDEYPRFVQNGEYESDFSIIIAGKNFGCGSSREHAPIALGAAGVKAVIAESYARIFFRNTIATGEFYPLESKNCLNKIFTTGEEAEISLDSSQVIKPSSGQNFELKSRGAVGPIIKAGGIFEYARASGIIREKTSSPPKKKTKVVAIANQKGGVGKTTSVINLSACLAELGQNILVIDLDPQANATSGFGLPQENGTSLYQALLGNGDIIDLIQPTSIKDVDIIPSEIDLAGAEVDIARMDGYLHCFSNLLSPLIPANKYDFILLDCPPSLGILTMNSLAAAHSIIIPIQCEYYALEGLSVISRLIQQLHESRANPLVEIEGILMTMYDSRTNLSAEVVTEVRRHFGDKVYKTIIPRNIRLSEAPSFGQPIIKFDKHSSGAKAYMLFAREFLRKNDSTLQQLLKC